MNKYDPVFEHRAVQAAAAVIEPDEGPLVILAGAIAAAKRRAVPLAVWLLLCLATAVWYLHVTPPSYTAVATLILDPKRPANSMGNTSAALQPAPTLDSAQAESQIQVIRSERLLSSVFNALNLAEAPSLRPGLPDIKTKVADYIASIFRTPRAARDSNAERGAAAFDAFTGRVGARRVGQSYVLEVSYTSEDAPEARRLANAVVSAYLGQQVSFKLAAAENGVEYLQSRVNSLTNEIKAAEAGMVAGTVPASLLPDADARVIGAALEPLGRSAPKSGLVVAFAGTFGLLSGIFAVSVLSGLDRRIRSTDQLERATGLPCLGAIPDVKRRKGFAKRGPIEMIRLARSNADGHFAAAIRDTRTSILLALDGKRGHAVGITSWSEGTGRSLLAANLAQVVAMSGSHVTLVDADIHRASPGLTALGAPVSVSLTEGLLDPTGATVPETAELDEDLSLVPAWAAESTRSFGAYLGAPGLSRLIEAWRAQGDVVLDLPPLAAGGDARAAAGKLDGVVILVQAGRTTADDVERAKNALSRAGANVIGTVLNRASS